MRSRVSLAIAACALLGSAGFLHTASGAEDQPIVAHDLKQLRVADKVSAVLWTRRNGYYTLQVVLPLRSGSGTRIAPPGLRPVTRAPAPASNPVAQVQVWLLGADGAALPPQSVSPPDARNIGLRTLALEARYSFSMAAGQEATAVAIQVDGAYFIEALKPL